MSKNEFDELLRRKFDESEFAYDEANWQKLAGKLPGDDKRRRIIPLVIVLTTCATAAAILLFVIPFLKPDKLNPAHVAKTTVEKNSNRTIPFPANKTVASERNIPETSQKANKTAYSKATTVKQVINSQQPRAENTDANTNEEVADNNDKTTAGELTEITSSTTKRPKATVNLNENIAWNSDDVPKTKPNAKASISLIGGVNNALDSKTGFAIGAGAHKSISKKVFVEGYISYVNSNTYNNVNTSSFSNPGSSTIGPALTGGGTFNTIPNSLSVNKQQTYQLQYVQFTPVFGYNLSKRLSVGAGADIQKLIDGDDIILDNITIPGTDLGAIGKAEYSFTKRINAGLQYRAALNNMIRANNNYLDRSYLQFQLKLRIIN